MKKIMLFIIIGFSLNSFGQNKRSIFDIEQSMLKPTENIHGKMENESLKSVKDNARKAIKIVTPRQLTQNSLTQLYDSINTWHWDTLSISWKIDTKEVNICYDANNNWISGFIQKWDGSAWVNFYRYYSTYDASNQITNDLTQNWNGKDWIDYMQTKITYDEENKIESYLYQIWGDSAWMNSTQVKFTYDVNNRESIELFQKWNVSSWLNDSQRIYTYNAIGTNTNQLNQFWAGDVWNNGYNLILSYDENNKNTDHLVQFWVAGSWKNTGKGIITYDANNNITSRLEQKLNESSFVNDYQRTYTYDPNNLRTSYTYKNWNDAGTMITSGDSTFYYYHTVATGTHVLIGQNENITVYPNPTTDGVRISGLGEVSTIVISDLNGKVWLSKKGTYNEYLPTDKLPNGIYLVRINTKEGSKAKKLVKQ